MVTALFDTNSLIDYLGGAGAAKKELARYENKAISTITWMEILVATTTDDEPAIRAWLGSFDVIALDTAIASRAVEIGKHKRIRLPDATVWASAQVHSLLLVSSNTQDFPADEPGVREPYKLYERRAAAGAWESAHGERRQRHDGFYVWIWIDAALDAVVA